MAGAYEWVNSYIGIPFLVNGRDMQGFDCYGLVVHVMQHQQGVSIVDWKVADERAVTAFAAMATGIAQQLKDGKAVEVEHPQDFDIVAIERHGMAIHLGVYINGGVLHTSKDTNGGAWQPLEFFNYGKPVFYRWQH